MLTLFCPALQTMKLEECTDLQKVELKPVGLQSLSLGTCPDLTSLTVEGPRLQLLDLKGCNLLSVLSLECASLLSLDATFCTQLISLMLGRALTAARMLQLLVLSVCSGLDPCMPLTAFLPQLTLLDLSYTNIQDLTAVAGCCPNLTSLNISSCRSIQPTALSCLLPLQTQSTVTCLLPQQQHMDAAHEASSTADVHQYGIRLPCSHTADAKLLLSSLDVSYCSLPTQAIVGLLLHGYSLKVLAMNGCIGATDTIWQSMNFPRQRGSSQAPPASQQEQPHALQHLSCVGCKRMRSCFLGMLPGLNSFDHRQGLHEVQHWFPATCHLSGLESLKLGLSGVRTVALALPCLTALDMNSCTEVRHLELYCPSLLTAYFQSCGLLGGAMITRALRGSCHLHTLDLQHTTVSYEKLQDLIQGQPALRSLLLPQQRPPRHSESPPD